MSFTIQNNTKSGSFSARSTYTKKENGIVIVSDWVHDRMGIIPSGTETRELSLVEAREEYKQRKAHGWQ